MKNIDDLLNKVNERMVSFENRFDQQYSEDKIKQIIDHLLEVRARKIIEDKVNKLFSDLDEALYQKIKDIMLEPAYVKSLLERLREDTAPENWEWD
jgi:hypothetical protein